MENFERCSDLSFEKNAVVERKINFYSFYSYFLDVSHDLTDEWSFEGTKEELFGSFCRLNAYNRQFYPQFKEDNNRLMFRMIMLGLKEEANPFEVMITFFHDTGTLFEWKDRVYPITKGKK